MSAADWRDRPVFVTGSTGLVGGWLVKRLLAAGADVVCLVRDSMPEAELERSGDIQRVKVVRGDVADRDCLERAIGEYQIATVFHLAAQTIVGVANRNPAATFEVNIRGQWNLLEACRRSAVEAIVTASSDKAYGDRQDLPYTEVMPLEGRHPYDVSKSCGDLIARAYAVSYGLPVAITRCGNIYGGGDLNWNRIVPGSIRAALRGQRPVIRSDGQYVRDYLYVEDAAAAYMLLAEKLAACADLRGQAFNISSETPIGVIDLAQRILKAMGSDLQPEIRNEAVNEIRHQYLSAAKARETLDWAPRFTIEEGLAKTIEWYREYFASAGIHRRDRPAKAAGAPTPG